MAEKKEREKEEGKDSDYVKWLSELSNKDIAVAGGKGASLAEMFNKNFPVPQAFIITAQAYKKFVSPIQHEIEKILDNTDIDNTKQLNENTKKIRHLIESQEMPKEMQDEILEAYEILGTEKSAKKEMWESKNALNILKRMKEPVFVAVRSSATTEDLAGASFAGQQESFLSIKGNTELIENIKKCFSSLYTARATYYREKKGFGHKSLLAVIIQKMINSDKSGVIFTSNPMKMTNDIIIEAVFGLGEGIVSGKINPDQYEISREIEIINKKIADKKKAIVRTSSGEIEEVRLTEERSQSQVLTDSEIKRLADISLQIEKHYKKPQDIEFAIEVREIYIVQSRPITTEAKPSHALEGKILLSGMPASPGIGIGKVKIIKNLNDLDKIKKGDILVTEMTNPDMVVTMQKCDAIITDEGGATSHAAIVSREMGIPAVVGTKTATQILQDNMIVTVDGSAGKVYEGKVLEEKKKEILPVVETNTKIKLILDLPDFAERAAKTNIKDVGLLRLEGIIAESGKHPMMFLAENRVKSYIEILEKGIEKIAKHFNSIWIRTPDIRTDEYRNLQGAPKEQETNPMLGFHGINFSLKHKELLEAELQAIKNVAEKFPDKKIGIMFPQVITIKQLQEAKKIFNKFKTKNIQFGAMIETPAACEIIEQICDEVDFISLGTNDLTQYTLAIDRGNENVQDLYNEMHPAILAQIARVINACKEKQVESSICGQAGSKKEMASFLVKNGIDSISVNADAANEISNFVQELEKHLEKDISKEEEPAESKLIEEPKIEEQLETQKVSKEATEKSEEFPDVDIGFDVFSPQTGEKQAEVHEIDELETVEEKIQEKREEVEQEKQEETEQDEKIEEAIETETEKPEEVPGFEEEQDNEVVEESEEEQEDNENQEVKEVIDEMRGEKDEEDIDIQKPEESDKEEDEDTLDIF